ncbi:MULTISPECIES: AAA family ATPase [Kamptonema]|uniref:AAA family ATPase n=1 Tax=Kamptonema TaxID=1501433 RepID=UPI0001DAD333|nr:MULTISPECIES: AAA family ATPase [Kamptonema]CBN55839.1 ATPase-like [Kamptonema sp. PCC 6506]
MLKRIYIDNFRCLVNFELSVDSINLFLGSNGAGKSTVFDVLRKIQAFVSGDSKVDAIFKSVDCTRWQTSLIQSFELEIEGNGGTYKYELAIEHDRDRNGNQTHIKYERLWFDNQPLLKFGLGEMQVFRDGSLSLEWKEYPFDLFQSMLALLMPRDDNSKLTWFKERMERFIILQINPSMMVDESSKEENRLSYRMENYVSWYRYLSQNQGKIFELTNTLKEIFEGFAYFKFIDAGEKIRLLKLSFSLENDRNKLVEYKLGELSDGQRMLIALYTLIICTKSEDYTLCLDEPENFLALPEIQPWLIQLYDLCSEQKTQALLISHHPVLIDYLLASPVGYWFERQSNTPVRVKRIGTDNDTGLPISELVARGWLHDS